MKTKRWTPSPTRMTIKTGGDVCVFLFSRVYAYLCTYFGNVRQWEETYFVESWSCFSVFSQQLHKVCG